RFPDTANNINNISWTNGDVIIPTHDCAPDGPGATVWYGAYRYYRQGTANPAQCVSTIASYSLKNGQHTFGQVFQNPLGTFNSRIITTPTSTSSILNSESYSVGYTAYDQIFGSTNGAQGTGTVQCPITTGTPRGNVLGPRYMLDISLRCNPGARTNTMGPYYNGNTYPTYGGYGFYFKFIWDALCYPCV
ncbi:MAG: hypothetical protein EBS19_16665, partial [Spirochaetia bacterium]|nr:hypothetical protein [Spirochaetia bacterium]